MLIVLGLAYPLAMTITSQALFSDKANGSLLKRGGVLIGSDLIAQKFEHPGYFWPRPSAVDYNPLASGGSNLGQASEDLKKIVNERTVKLKPLNPEQSIEPPQDLIFASASGLDPHISIEAADYQVERVAHERKMNPKEIRILLASLTEGRDFKIFGEPKVNVLALNLALDKLQGIEAAPVLLPVSHSDKK